MRKRFSLQLLWNIGRALEKTVMLNVNAKDTSEDNNIVLDCDRWPIPQHRYVWPLRGCHDASQMGPHGHSLRSAGLLVEKAKLAFAQPDPLDHPLLQHKKARAIRKVASLKQPMMYESTEEAPSVMHIRERRKADKRPPTKSYQAASLPAEGSARQITERPAKKPARSSS